MTHSPSSAQSELSDERINELALLNLGYDRTIRPLDFARAIEREVRAAASAQETQAVEEGCTPADAKMLRAANHSLATENDMLRMRLRPFAQVAVGPLSWATVEYHVEGDSEKQIFRTPSMQRAFNRAADALRELTPPPNDDYEVDRGTHIERVPFYNADLSATPPSPDAASAHTIGEDAANVAIGEREAFERWITTECNYDPVDMVTQPGGEVYVLAGVQEAWDAWMGSVEARAAAPQGLTDEQIHERVLLACHSDPVSFTGQYVLTLDEIRALLTVAQPASSLAEGGERADQA